MSDAEDLTQRYLTLWTQYLAALLADPRAMEAVKRWIAFADQFSYPPRGAGEAGGAPSPVWPPFFGPFGLPGAFPGSEAAGDAATIAVLARRVEELERRLAAVEQQAKPRNTRRRPHGGTT
jgi:hypothetical protein